MVLYVVPFLYWPGVDKQEEAGYYRMVLEVILVLYRPGVDEQEEHGHKEIVPRHSKTPETKAP